MWQMLRVPQLLQNAWYKIPWERQTEWAEEPQERRQLALSWAEKARSRPKLALHDITTCECTWPKNHPVLYSGTEGRGYVRRTHPAQGQNCPKESSQLLPSRLLRSPLSQRRQEELTAKAATGTRAEVASPGRQEKHQHLGRNKHEPTHPHKSLCSGKWRVTCFKNKKYLMKMNHENESWPFVTREGQTTTAASAEQLCVPGRLKWKDPDTTVPVRR